MVPSSTKLAKAWVPLPTSKKAEDFREVEKVTNVMAMLQSMGKETTEFDVGDQKLWENLQWQSRVVDSLSDYIAVIVDAFEAISRSLKDLDDAGIDDAIDAGPVAQALRRGLRQALDITREMANKLRTPLDTQRETLSACAADLSSALAAGLEEQRCNEKLASLLDNGEQQPCCSPPGARGSARALARFEQNRDRLEKASSAAQVSATAKRSRARDMLVACESRRGKICGLACEAFTSTVEALLAGTGRTTHVVASPSARAASTPRFHKSADGMGEPGHSLGSAAAPVSTPRPRQQAAAADDDSTTVGRNPFDFDSGISLNGMALTTATFDNDDYKNPFDDGGTSPSYYAPVPPLQSPGMGDSERRNPFELDLMDPSALELIEVEDSPCIPWRDAERPKLMSSSGGPARAQQEFLVCCGVWPMSRVNR